MTDWQEVGYTAGGGRMFVGPIGSDPLDAKLRQRSGRPKSFEFKLPDPVPHELAEVWNNADAVVARTCQRCGKTFGPHQLAVHPSREAAGVRVAEREGFELIVSPYMPEDMMIKMDPVTLDFLGCPGR